MINMFYLWAAAMVGLAVTVLVLLPRLWHRSASGESTIDWLRLRKAELERERDVEGVTADPDLLVEAELRVIDEVDPGALDAAPDAGEESIESGASSGGPLIWALVLLLVLGLPFGLYYQLGAIDDVRITQSLDELDQSTPENIAALLAEIEQRSAARPDNADYLSLLGEYYTAGEDYDKALAAYEQLLTLFPDSPEVLARAAQAEFLARSRTLTAAARRRAEAALAADPNQRTALGTLGMAAFESGDYAAALGYWERLIAFETPGSPGYQMMSTVINEARNRGGLSTPAAPSIGVMVTVSLPDGVSAPPEATVFVLARPAGGQQRMPTAVVRRRVADLPLTVTLDDGNAMAGQKISVLGAVDIEVQVSPTGQPGRSNASWLATASNVVPSTEASIELILGPVTP